MIPASVFRCLCLAFGLADTVYGAKLTEVKDWGGRNSSTLSMHIYVPNVLPPKPAVIAVPHPCSGSAQNTFSSVTPRLASYADKLGIVLIFPSTTGVVNTLRNCWDDRGPNALKRNGGSDNKGIVNQINYVLAKYKADTGRVFTTGSSSGGMITNILLATYPDVFAGGASFSGAPAGSGQPARTSAQAWGDVVRIAYPEFNGTRPKMQVWHGTADTVVPYQYFGHQLGQWSDALGVKFSKNVTGDPEAGYTKMEYGDGTKLMGYHAQNVGHVVPSPDEPLLKFFGLM
ncbi:hypothetical protein IFR04_009671 [Cadophora malorum]|uniref:Carboxylic ester hydrolase n=1 Tax=Cadophora malorum TaxID=108018 RepID=A0A8H7W6K3_9HELO|nr:hypothetical protein IFR04_009671 [Cadophora malorum]